MTEVRCVETREEEGGGEGTEGARSRNERSLMHLRIDIAFFPVSRRTTGTRNIDRAEAGRWCPIWLYISTVTIDAGSMEGDSAAETLGPCL